jgi:hypothetical protein
MTPSGLLAQLDGDVIFPIGFRWLLDDSLRGCRLPERSGLVSPCPFIMSERQPMPAASTMLEMMSGGSFVADGSDGESQRAQW